MELRLAGLFLLVYATQAVTEHVSECMYNILPFFWTTTVRVYWIGRAEQNGRTEQNIKIDG